MALIDPDDHNVGQEVLDKHPDLFEDVLAEDIGFVQGFRDIRDYWS